MAQTEYCKSCGEQMQHRIIRGRPYLACDHGHGHTRRRLYEDESLRERLTRKRDAEIAEIGLAAWHAKVQAEIDRDFV